MKEFRDYGLRVILQCIGFNIYDSECDSEEVWSKNGKVFMFLNHNRNRLTKIEYMGQEIEVPENSHIRLVSENKGLFIDVIQSIEL